MPTEPFRDVLLEVWREAGRHIEIHESSATIAAMLERHLPLAALLVRRFDASGHALDTVAGILVAIVVVTAFTSGIARRRVWQSVARA